jgi:glycosyltransferase involved in cell wall biosynthesis
MRIAIITTGFSKDAADYGGAAAFHNLIRELSLQKEIDLSIFAFYYPFDKPEYNFYKAKVFSFASPGKLNELKKFNIWRKCEKKFAEEHNNEKFDIVHSMWAGESGFVASRFSRKFKIPFIANIAGGELAGIEEIGYGSRIKQVQRYFVDRTFSKAQVIISGSDFITDKIKTYYDEIILSKVKKIPFGIVDSMFFVKEMYSGISDAPALISVANVVPVKSHETLFKALKIVNEKYPALQLECYGRDDRNILEDLAWSNGVAGNVISGGLKDYENIPDVLNNGAIFVSSSLYESENMSVIEAAFCGLPVVSTAVGAAPEITEHLAAPSDFETLAKKIIYVIENYPVERQKALNKRASLVEKYSLKTAVQSFIDLYKSLCL